MNSPVPTWILVADCGCSRLFARNSPKGELIELTDLSSADDSPPDSDNHVFAAHLADFLQQALERGRYGQLILISPPEFLNVLRGKLSSEVCQTVAELIGLDMTKSPIDRIQARAPKLPNHG